MAAALADGAKIDALDDRGMSPLHHAIAHRCADVVAELLATGADPARQSDFSNAPHFAVLDPTGIVKAAADRIDDDIHWQILRMLIEAGAPVNAGDLTGATLLDLAVATRPYPKEAVRFLTKQGARVTRQAGDLTKLLARLPYGSRTDLEIRVNEVRLLLEAGASADGALHALLGTYGYYEHEVPSDILTCRLTRCCVTVPGMSRTPAAAPPSTWLNPGPPAAISPITSQSLNFSALSTNGNDSRKRPYLGARSGRGAGIDPEARSVPRTRSHAMGAGPMFREWFVRGLRA
ncbi:hypothetical protein ABT272_41610 [Streptomyces sp900105245]|uniref:Ankyrin repeat protein n=1 Tax=Streptomyces sp. 900105245 TaxID=3154379 RepID=A0ABV1UK64_9ACTN